ncbi:MAG TPA: hypothetical protein VHE36_01225 [Sphingomicrobium sp.]|jgi:hypothetical protein|nr:hypothetical protein [Sphingomicrobium sp.]
MRPVLAIVSLSLFATPAAAQSAAGAPLPPPHAMQLPPRVADPATAARLVDSMQALSRALLEIRIGGVQAALEGRSATPAERNLTVGDLARRDNPGVERDLQQKIAEARPMIEQGIRAMNDSLPAIQQGLVDAQRSLERAIANMPDPNYPKR